MRVYGERLLHNYRQFAGIVGPLSIAPVLKSNAYGHGLIEVARVLDEQRPPFLVVDGYFEALMLRNEGIRSRILVIGHAATENILRNRLNDVAFCISDLRQLDELTRRLRRRTVFHLKIDTGMHRNGVLCEDAERALAAAQRCQAFLLVGLCSHFAHARGTPFTMRQIAKWNQVASLARDSVSTLEYFHIANTAGTAWTGQAQANVARLGTGLYGIDSHPGRQLGLRPALDVVSRIAALKPVAAGGRVGYSLTYTAAGDRLLALVPTGYYSCVDVRLGNRGQFRVRGTDCPIVGSVSMNTTTIDVSHISQVRRGEEVVVISGEEGASNSVASIASLCEALPYHVFAAISPKLKRVII